MPFAPLNLLVRIHHVDVMIVSSSPEPVSGLRLTVGEQSAARRRWQCYLIWETCWNAGDGDSVIKDRAGMRSRKV